MKKILAIVILIIGLVITSSCKDDTGTVDIYTSIYPVEFIVQKIVGTKYVVKSVYPRGKDVHDYEPAPKDIIKMANSKIIFYIGLGLEPIIENAKDSTLANVPLIKLSSNLTLVELNGDHSHEHTGDENELEDNIYYDPHVWLDPDKMIKMTDTVYENIIKYIKPSADDTNYLTTNANNLKQEFINLDKEFFEVVNDNTLLNKTIIVDHDAYAYWQARYGVERIRLRNNNESTDVSPSEMQEKIALAKSLGIKYICTTKNELESAIINQYLTQLGLTQEAKVQLHHLATITSDEENSGLDYFSIMRENIEVLRTVLPRK